MTDKCERAVIANERALRIGGLRRCCIQTVRENEVALTVVGNIIKCPSCRQAMVVASDGIWEELHDVDD